VALLGISTAMVTAFVAFENVELAHRPRMN
jgi:hypothetical protein